MRRLPGVLVLLAVVICRPARAVQLDALDPQREYRLGALRFAGTDTVRGRQLRAVMLTPTRPWFARWRPLPPFDPVTFRTDLDRIHRLYESRGYYAAAVTHDVELPAEGETVTAVISVDEGRKLGHLGPTSRDGLRGWGMDPGH